MKCLVGNVIYCQMLKILITSNIFFRTETNFLRQQTEQQQQRWQQQKKRDSATCSWSAVYGIAARASPEDTGHVFFENFDITNSIDNLNKVIFWRTLVHDGHVNCCSFVCKDRQKWIEKTLFDKAPVTLVERLRLRV